ncbi:universal stress protein [Streptomyces albiflavescens]|uniref:universal stress protein n=1 Tax=Streptomyces albiflavescens TaxID=1623582 RepID=UPI00227CDA2C|nr:universal stress protein [Streptomyces albiflavescens]
MDPAATRWARRAGTWTPQMLVVGSNGHGAVAGLLLDSVGQQVLVRVRRPVVMVPSNARSAAEHDGGPIVHAVLLHAAAPAAIPHDCGPFSSGLRAKRPHRRGRPVPAAAPGSVRRWTRTEQPDLRSVR